MTAALHTPADLAEKFGKDERWVLDQVRQHGWPRVKVGRTIRFTDDQLALILSRHTLTAKPIDTEPGIAGQTKRSKAASS